MANGPNPVLLVRDHIPEHIRELEEERDKLIARLREVCDELALASLLLAVNPPPTPSTSNGTVIVMERGDQSVPG